MGAETAPARVGVLDHLPGRLYLCAGKVLHPRRAYRWAEIHGSGSVSDGELDGLFAARGVEEMHV